MRLELKIIDLLCKDLEKKFTINEISKSLKEAYSFVNRIVTKLINERVINKERVGKAYLCSLNLENDKVIALIHLNEVSQKEKFYRENKKIHPLLEEFLERIKSTKNILFAVVFGSYAKGTATKESDIDVLIVCKKKIDLTRIIREIHAKYGKEIVPIIMTPDEFKAQKDKPIIKEIVKYHYVLSGFKDFIETLYES